MNYHKHHVQVNDLLSLSKIKNENTVDVYDYQQARDEKMMGWSHDHHQMRRKGKKGEKVN